MPLDRPGEGLSENFFPWSGEPVGGQRIMEMNFRAGTAGKEKGYVIY